MFHKLICQCHFHWPPKLHGPRGHCSPLPPSRWSCLNATSAEARGRAIFSHCLFLSSRRSGDPSLAPALVAFRPDGT